MDLTHEGPDPAGPGRRCRAALLAVAAGAVVLAGCSTPSTGPSGPTPAQARQQLARVLRAWAVFPASASPRPIVLTSPRISDPASGFPDAATKLAYIAGAISPPAALPPGPATAAGYPLISAGAAVDVLTSVAVQGPAPSVRLAVIAMSLGTGVSTPIAARSGCPPPSRSRSSRTCMAIPTRPARRAPTAGTPPRSCRSGSAAGRW